MLELSRLYSQFKVGSLASRSIELLGGLVGRTERGRSAGRSLVHEVVEGEAT